MHKGHKSINGVISVFVALMLTSVFSLGTFVLEAGRFQAAKTQLTDANVSASTSMIAAYDADLYARYGLLAIDKEMFTQERCIRYLDFNSDLTAGFLGNNISRMYKVSSAEMLGMYNLTYPAVLKRQILSRAKYHVIPQDYALNLYTVDAFLGDMQNRCAYVVNALEKTADGVSGGSIDDISAEMQAALTVLYNNYKDSKKYDDTCVVNITSGSTVLLPSTTGTIESTIPQEDIDAISDTLSRASTVLGGDASKLSSSITVFSQTDVNVDTLYLADMTEKIKDVTSLSDIAGSAKECAIACSDIAQSISAAINMLSNDKEGNLLLNSYISSYFSNRNNTVDGYIGPGKNSNFVGDNANFAAACVEYIFSGNSSEKRNQEKAYDYIAAIRLINNLYSVLSSSQSINTDSTFSVIAHIAWAYYETCTDMMLLANYNTSVPFGKYNLILDVNNCGAVSVAFGSANFANAMNALGVYDGTDFIVAGSDDFFYKDCLALALWLVPNSEKMLRVADLIQLEMRYQEQYVEHNAPLFLMSEQNTYCRIKCVAELNSILPMLSAGLNGQLDGMTFSSIKYAGY